MSDLKLVLAYKHSQGYSDCSTSLEEHDEIIRNKAIDDFIRSCKTSNDGLITNWDKPYGISFEKLNNIAEQLKTDRKE